MSLATEETKTVYRDNRGEAFNSKKIAELSTVKNITGTRLPIDEIDKLFRTLTTHGDLREYLLEQLGVESTPQHEVDMQSAMLQAKPSVCDHKTDTFSDVLRKTARNLEDQGYSLVKHTQPAAAPVAEVKMPSEDQLSNILNIACRKAGVEIQGQQYWLLAKEILNLVNTPA